MTTDCVKIKGVRAAFVALDLPEAEEREVREHVRTCESCRSEFVLAESALLFALRATGGSTAFGDEEDFVKGVMTGIRQRNVEQRVERRGSVWRAGAAAAVLLVVALGSGRLLMSPAREARMAVVDQVLVQDAETADPVFFEVEGRGVRLYQYTTGGERPIPVAFVVDPSVEL